MNARSRSRCSSGHASHSKRSTKGYCLTSMPLAIFSMIETVRLRPQNRGYGIGLLAVDERMKHVGRASSRWSNEGLIVLDPSGLTSDLAQGHSHEEVQEKSIRYWQMLGLWVLVRERKRHCTIVGHWMGDQRPDIAAVVPHLLE
jgi:hypothetical protein